MMTVDQCRCGLPAVAYPVHRIPLVGQAAYQARTDHGIVFDDEDAHRCDRSPSDRARVSGPQLSGHLGAAPGSFARRDRWRGEAASGRVERQPSRGLKENRWPATVASYMAPPLTMVKTATPL